MYRLSHMLLQGSHLCRLDMFPLSAVYNRAKHIRSCCQLVKAIHALGFVERATIKEATISMPESTVTKPMS